MAPIDEKKLRGHIIERIKALQMLINKTMEEKDEEMTHYFMGGQTELAKLLQTLNDI